MVHPSRPAPGPGPAAPPEPPRPAVPPPGSWPPPPAAPGPAGLSPGQAAAGIATGVLCLWTPFTLIVATVLATVPDCAGSRAAICTPGGHLVAIWSSTVGAALGLAVVVIPSWIYPRRQHGLAAFAGVAIAAAALLITLGLADGAPVA